MRDAVTLERLKEVLRYDPETGKFFWLEDRSSRVRKGMVAGYTDPESGYTRIIIDGTFYYAHRLAVLYVTGAWPEKQVDHKNLDRSDNRYKNLRPATNGQNTINQGLKANNKSGFKGVSWSRGMRQWWAQIKYDGIHYNLGYYNDPAEAGRVYVEMARQLHGEFARV